MAITAKQKRFCDEYLIDLNATQAAIRAGYSNKYANTNVSKLLQNTTIKAYLDARMAEKESELIAGQDEVLKYLTAVMRGESVSEELMVEGCGEGISQVVHVDKKPSEKERLKAAELLGKRYGLYTEKIDVNAAVDMELNINIDYGDDNDEDDS